MTIQPGDQYSRNVYTPAGRHDIAFLYEVVTLVFRQLDLRALRFAGLLVSMVVLEAACLTICVPTAPVNVRPGSTIFAEIKVASVIGLEREMSSAFTTVEPAVLPWNFLPVHMSADMTIAR
ncbi:MAG: hypothetical protein ACYC4D_05285 [Thermoleophilia bacterium]